LIVLQPILRRFMADYPEINLETRVENLLVDIVSQGFDAGIRFGSSVEKDMVAIPIGPPLKAQVCWRRRRIDIVAEMSLSQSDSSQTITCSRLVLFEEGQSYIGTWVNSASASTGLDIIWAFPSTCGL
jgi:DNA-binding transcriptional LysR family regulator